MIVRIARRDIRKSWKRSLAVISAVAISVFLLVISGGYMDGFIDKFYKQAVRETGHILINAPDYRDRIDLLPLEPNLELHPGLIDSLRALPHVANVRPVIRYGALANSPDRTLEMELVGSTQEGLSAMYSRLQDAVVEGHFLNGPNQLMIGTEAARLLNASAGDKLILLTTDSYGGMSAVEPVIAGVFKSLNSLENSTMILTDLATTQKLLGLPNRVTEISLELERHEQIVKTLPLVKTMLGPSYDVTSWEKNQASLLSMLEISKIGMGIISAIILIVASLGMINTFLISVLERLPEFGTLRAIGLRARQLMLLVVVQGIFLGILGTALGLIMGLPIVFYYQANPFDLGEAMSGLEGIDSLLWFTFRWETVIFISALGIIVAVLASLYPAWYASRKRPVEVLRNIA